MTLPVFKCRRATKREQERTDGQLEFKFEGKANRVEASRPTARSGADAPTPEKAMKGWHIVRRVLEHRLH